MKMILALIWTLTLSAAALAQEIRWKPERLRPGDYVSLDQSRDGPITHVFRGKTGRGFLIESHAGKGPKGRLVFRTILDRDGNYLRWQRADGFEIRYTPHDCTRTPGRCQYREIHSDGTEKRRLRVTKAVKGGFRFDEYGADGTWLFGGRFKLDDRGFAGDGVIKGSAGRQKFRLVKRAYR